MALTSGTVLQLI